MLLSSSPAKLRHQIPFTPYIALKNSRNAIHRDRAESDAAPPPAPRPTHTHLSPCCHHCVASALTETKRLPWMSLLLKLLYHRSNGSITPLPHESTISQSQRSRAVVSRRKHTFHIFYHQLASQHYSSESSTIALTGTG